MFLEVAVQFVFSIPWSLPWFDWRLKYFVTNRCFGKFNLCIVFQSSSSSPFSIWIGSLWIWKGLLFKWWWWWWWRRRICYVQWMMILYLVVDVVAWPHIFSLFCAILKAFKAGEGERQVQPSSDRLVVVGCGVGGVGDENAVGDTVVL